MSGLCSELVAPTYALAWSALANSISMSLMAMMTAEEGFCS